MSSVKLGQNQESIQASNKALLLELIRSEKNCSRATLSKISGLQPTTVTYIVNDFIQKGIIEETGLISGKRGRRSIEISITDKNYAVLGIRIARQGFSLGVYTLNGHKILEKDYTYPGELSGAEIVAFTSNKAEELIGQAEGYRILTAGIAVPGPFNTASNRIMFLTESADWGDIDIHEEFSKQLGLDVVCLHDANAGALSQLWMNPQVKRTDTIFYVSVGQGVGGGILMNGNIMEGSRGYAGEIGHMSIDYRGPLCKCGNHGCLENYTSSIALAKAVNKEMGSDYSFDEIVELIRKGEEIPVKHFNQVCDFLAIGMVNLFNSLDPDKIILGDQVAKILPEVMQKRIKAGIAKRTLPKMISNLEVLTINPDHNAELHGAGVAAIRSIYQNYSSYFN